MIDWILVANRSGAKIFSRPSRTKSFSLIKELENPDGRLKNGELVSDQHGRSFAGTGKARHSYSEDRDPSQHLMEKFIKELCATIEKDAYSNNFDGLTVVAEQTVLGELRKNFQTHTKRKLADTCAKDLAYMSDADIISYLDRMADQSYISTLNA